MDAEVMLGFAILGTGLAGTAGSGLIWAIRQEGRIKGHDDLFVEREKLDIQRHEAIISRLDRIERKQDTANGKG